MFKISARTLLELGSELISSDAIAFYELIKNGIDAKTKAIDGVSIKFEIVLHQSDLIEILESIDKGRNNLNEGKTVDPEEIAEFASSLRDKLLPASGTIYHEALKIVDAITNLDSLQKALKQINTLNRVVISDTGTGMSLQELSEVFLVLGTNSRKLAVDEALRGGKDDTPYLGEKGIGRLSAMRLGDKLTVRTAQEKDERFNMLDIDWSDFNDSRKMIEDIQVKPYKGNRKSKPGYSGTELIIGKLKADWDYNRIERIAKDEFSLFVNPIGNVSSHRIAIFWNDERINFPRLDKSLLSHAHAKLEGKYEITDGRPELNLKVEISNLGFEHPPGRSSERVAFEDLSAALIGARQRRGREGKRDVNLAALTHVGPFEFELYWFNRSTLRKGRTTGNFQALRNSLDQWMGVRLYRDGFRVYPYGTQEDDWLELDRTALRAKGYALNRIQFVGHVCIGRFTNPYLIDQTNREGLRHTPEEVILKEAIQFAIDRLRDEMKRVESIHRQTKPRIVTDESRTEDFEKRMTRAVKHLSTAVTEENEYLIYEFETLKGEFSRYVAEARKRIAELERDTDQMLAMAGIGLMVEVVAHELTRSAEDALDTLNKLQSNRVPDEIRDRLQSLRSSMQSIKKRLLILDPLNVTSRQRKERFELDNLVKQILEAHEGQFERHKVNIKCNYSERPISIQAVKGMVVQVIENLISNSIYWMTIEGQHKINFKPVISISVENNPPRIRFSDNGPGISKEYRERIFDLFFSLKDKSHRRGLGLFIARDAAEHNGGRLLLDTDVVNDEGRYSTFDYIVVGDIS